jgi:hypothetical protein
VAESEEWRTRGAQLRGEAAARAVGAAVGAEAAWRIGGSDEVSLLAERFALGAASAPAPPGGAPAGEEDEGAGEEAPEGPAAPPRKLTSPGTRAARGRRGEEETDPMANSALLLGTVELDDGSSS